MRTDLSEEAVARRGSVGWGAECHEREMEGGQRVERSVSCIVAFAVRFDDGGDKIMSA